MNILLHKSRLELPFVAVEEYLRNKGVEFYPYYVDYGPFATAEWVKISNTSFQRFLLMDEVSLLKEDMGECVSEGKAMTKPQIKLDINRVRTDEEFIRILFEKFHDAEEQYEVVEIEPGEIFDITFKDKREHLIFPFKGDAQKSSSGKVLLRKGINARLNLPAFARVLEIMGEEFWVYRECSDFSLEKVSKPYPDEEIFNIVFTNKDFGECLEDEDNVILSEHTIDVSKRLMYEWDDFRFDEKMIRTLFLTKENVDASFSFESIAPDKAFYILSNKDEIETLITEDYFEGLSCSE